MKIRHILSLSLVLLVVVACNVIVSDPTFDTWCGDHLCNWQVETGRVRRARSWHSGDDAVELVDTPTVLSQHINLSPCLDMRLVADVDPAADVAVEIDVGSDGSVDLPIVIPSGPAWSLQRMLIELPSYVGEGSLRIHKRGVGRAEFGRLSVRNTADCTSMTPRAIGFDCSTDGECQSGVCAPSPVPFGGLCSECRDDSECPTNAMCGLVAASLPHRACTPKGTAHEGEPCASDSQCADGFICGAGPATGGGLIFGMRAPMLAVCKRAASVANDDPCFGDRECASGACCAQPNYRMFACKSDHSACR